MNALAGHDWRRWIATLCVALVAFVMVGHSTCADPCRNTQATACYSVSAVSDADGDQRDSQSPVSAQQHHCCFKTVSGLPSAPRIGVTAQASLQLEAPTDARPPHSEQGGQDRPPRHSALV